MHSGGLAINAQTQDVLPALVMRVTVILLLILRASLEYRVIYRNAAIVRVESATEVCTTSALPVLGVSIY